jgi:hypothetical protein
MSLTKGHSIPAVGADTTLDGVIETRFYLQFVFDDEILICISRHLRLPAITYQGRVWCKRRFSERPGLAKLHGLLGA